MKKFALKYKWIAVSLLFASIGCIAIANENRFHDWLKQNIDDDEELICDLEVMGDYFFVAMNDGVIKTGSLIDVDQNGGMPKRFIISWQFNDQNDRYLERRIRPEPVKQDYISRDGKLYAENVYYRNLDLEMVKKLYVYIKLKKYEAQSAMPESISELEARGEVEKSLICKVEL